MGPEDDIGPVTYYWGATPDGPWHLLNNRRAYRDLSQFFVQSWVRREEIRLGWVE